MAHKQRLTGVDLLRVISIFAVIILHSDEGISTVPKGWGQILEFSSFAVPFFLATSFYLSFNKIHATRGTYPLKERLVRLLIPYCSWTTVYIAYKLFKCLLQNELGSCNELFHDPVALIFFGGAAFQLYFLPLLASGTILIKPIFLGINKSASLFFALLLLIVSLMLYQLLLLSGNSFQIASGTAFQALLNYPIFLSFKDNPIIRIILTELALIIRCLPYIFTAVILNYPEARGLLHKKSNIGSTVLWIVLFLLINIFGKNFILVALYELTQGYCALLLGIVLSDHLPPSKIINSLSICSFGIYLIHLLFIESLQILEFRVYPTELFRVSTPNLLIFSLLSLVLSWIATDILRRRKNLSKLMFGN